MALNGIHLDFFKSSGVGKDKQLVHEERKVMDAHAWAQAVLDEQPFSKLVGCKLSKIEGCEVELYVDIRDELKQHHGFVHGGVLAYMADMSLTFAGALAFHGTVLTAEFKLNFLRPGVGQRVIARGSLINATRSQAVVRADIFVVNDQVEKICATALGTIANRQVTPK
jgi:uncharacterized protein (TIGR00369 family)